MPNQNLMSDSKSRFDNEYIDSCISAAADGDTSGIARLYEHTKSAVYGFALSILKNPHDAEDVLQDTYIKIFSSASTYASDGKPMAWILTIAKNLSLMKIRSNSKSSDVEIEDLNIASKENISNEVENRMILNDALKILGEDEMQIVVLHASCGMKHKDISQILNIGLSTTISKYNRALKKLRTHLTKGGLQ